MSEQPDHELEVLEEDETVAPRPEEVIADAFRDTTPETEPPKAAPAAPPVSPPE